MANSARESGHKWGIINTWDNMIISWGGPQYACNGGGLPGMLCAWKKNSPATFQAFLGVHKVDCVNNKLVVDGDSTLRSACTKMATDKDILASFMLAGNNRAVVREQIRKWRDYYNGIVNYKPKDCDKTVSQLIHVEYNAGLLCRYNNWMPGPARTFVDNFVKTNNACAAFSADLETRFGPALEADAKVVHISGLSKAPNSWTP